MKKVELKFTASKSSGEVSGILVTLENPKAFLVYAHGAGAPMNHPFMNLSAALLAENGIATFRYNFPYTERKSKRIDPVPILLETVRSAVSKTKEYSGDRPLFAGGKSMGGRMTSQAAAEGKLEGIKGIIFFGFPLHAPGREGTERAVHLFKIKLPMLFLQGSRDKLANPDLLIPAIKKIGKNAELYLIDGADHSFHVLKSSGRTDEEILKNLTRKAGEWVGQLIS